MTGKEHNKRYHSSGIMRQAKEIIFHKNNRSNRTSVSQKTWNSGAIFQSSDASSIQLRGTPCKHYRTDFYVTGKLIANRGTAGFIIMVYNF